MTANDVNTVTFGVNVTRAQRDALDREAARRGISRNALVRALAEDIARGERHGD